MEENDKATPAEKAALDASSPPVSSPIRAYEITPRVRDQIDQAFTYHAPKGDQPSRYIALRDQGRDLALLIARLTPPSREQSLALTKLEEAVMHANSAIARNE